MRDTENDLFDDILNEDVNMKIEEEKDALKLKLKYKIVSGDGKILVRSPLNYDSSKKKSKLIRIIPDLKDRIDKQCIGSKVRAIEILLQFALDELERRKKNIEI